jgi:hypothetical protein
VPLPAGLLSLCFFFFFSDFVSSSCVGFLGSILLLLFVCRPGATLPRVLIRAGSIALGGKNFEDSSGRSC